MFLSKQERVAAALQRRKEAVEEERKKREAEREARSKYLEEARDHRSSERRRREEESRGDMEPVAMGKEQEKELEAIKSRYLGAEKKRKKVRRLADRKFVFEWDTGEDTSTDFNPM